MLQTRQRIHLISQSRRSLRTPRDNGTTRRTRRGFNRVRTNTSILEDSTDHETQCLPDPVQNPQNIMRKLLKKAVEVRL